MMKLQDLFTISLLLLISGCQSVSGFAPPGSGIESSSSSFVLSYQIPQVANTNSVALSNPIGARVTGSTTLKCALLPTIVTKISPPVRNALLFGTAAVAVYKNRRVFYPGSAPDPSFSEPLPEGSLGCPLFGNLGVIFKSGDAQTGPGKFFREQASTVPNPTIFKYMFLGKPTIMLSGMKNVKEAFNTEFKRIKTGVAIKNFTRLFGGSNLLFITDQERHQYMRKLLGQSMTPEAINNAVPSLITGALNQIDTLKNNPTQEMEKVLTSFTLDVAWRQILGLDLKEDEIETFFKATDDWIGGVTNLRVMLLPGFESTKSAKALKYLKEKIERKIDDLNANGPDGSTMSYMVYARDEEDETKRLSREEIIDNALLLILAGSETAASTLTVAMLALGLHKDVFMKLKDEQINLIAKKGEDLTRSMLDKDCPYLDAVIKETMRLKPLAGTGALRFAQETFTIDGKQVPKGYGVAFNIRQTHELDPAVKVPDGSHMDIVQGFKPERWLNESTKPTEYMPFGYGPRFCLGYNLAMAEMKVFLALFARRVGDFDLVNMSPDSVSWKKASIIPKPADGAVITVKSLIN